MYHMTSETSTDFFLFECLRLQLLTFEYNFQNKI